jgi:hypothetical protein
MPERFPRTLEIELAGVLSIDPRTVRSVVEALRSNPAPAVRLVAELHRRGLLNISAIPARATDRP